MPVGGQEAGGPRELPANTPDQGSGGGGKDWWQSILDWFQGITDPNKGGTGTTPPIPPPGTKRGSQGDPDDPNFGNPPPPPGSPTGTSRSTSGANPTTQSGLIDRKAIAGIVSRAVSKAVASTARTAGIKGSPVTQADGSVKFVASASSAETAAGGRVAPPGSTSRTPGPGVAPPQQPSSGPRQVIVSPGRTLPPGARPGTVAAPPNLTGSTSRGPISTVPRPILPQPVPGRKPGDFPGTAPPHPDCGPGKVWNPVTGQCEAPYKPGTPPGPPPPGPGPGNGNGGGSFPGYGTGAMPFPGANFPMWVWSGANQTNAMTPPIGESPTPGWNEIFGYTSPTAPAPDASGNCPTGYYPSADGKSCISGTPPPGTGNTCPAGWKYDPATQACVQSNTGYKPPNPTPDPNGNCPAGYTKSVDGKTCVPVQTGGGDGGGGGGGKKPTNATVSASEPSTVPAGGAAANPFNPNNDPSIQGNKPGTGQQFMEGVYAITGPDGKLYAVSTHADGGFGVDSRGNPLDPGIPLANHQSWFDPSTMNIKAGTPITAPGFGGTFGNITTQSATGGGAPPPAAVPPPPPAAPPKPFTPPTPPTIVPPDQQAAYLATHPGASFTRDGRVIAPGQGGGIPGGGGGAAPYGGNQAPPRSTPGVSNAPPRPGTTTVPPRPGTPAASAVRAAGAGAAGTQGSSGSSFSTPLGYDEILKNLSDSGAFSGMDTGAFPESKSPFSTEGFYS